MLAIGGGITAPSFYAAFGSKEALFKEVVAHYLDTHGRVNASLWDTSLPPREAIERALRRSAKMQSERGHPKGCLMVLSASTCSPEHSHVQKLLAKSHVLSALWRQANFPPTPARAHWPRCSTAF